MTLERDGDALAAHERQSTGRVFRQEMDQPPPAPAQRPKKGPRRRVERTPEQERWLAEARARTARRAAAARSLGILVSDYMARLYQMGIRR